MGKLEARVALITGSGSGIGRAVRLIRDGGGEAVFIDADVSQTTDVQRMVETVAKTYGRLDILYSNAGIQGPVVLTADLKEDDWDLVLNTNLKSVFLGAKYVIPIMLKQGGGVIINTSSTMGLGGKARIAPYCVSKGGIIQLTKTMAVEYAKQNIRVNCICPGVIETPMGTASARVLRMDLIPRGEAGKPEDVARAALYLASDDASYVTGVILAVDGGWSAAIILPFKEQGGKK
ncbi:MAG: SDR family oxidoreductase [Chloroflexi bacterium]|nr:SDR family oxidoreductase [Chloroflexota bacterium]